MSLLSQDNGAAEAGLAGWHGAGLALLTGSELVRRHGSSLEIETRGPKERIYRFSVPRALWG